MMTLIDQIFLKKQISKFKIEYMLTLIKIQDLKSITHQCNKFVQLTIYLLNNNECTTVITQETYIVENLKTKMLVKMNVLISEIISINLVSKVVMISSC